MRDLVTFKPSTRLQIKTGLFFVCSAVVVYFCWEGFRSVTGANLILLQVASVFPMLVFGASILQLAAVMTRRVSVSDTHLEHRQVFKHYSVQLYDISLIEKLCHEDGEPDTIRVTWSGVPFYIDARAVDDFPVLVNCLAQRVPAEKMVKVEEFTPTTTSA